MALLLAQTIATIPGHEWKAAYTADDKGLETTSWQPWQPESLHQNIGNTIDVNPKARRFGDVRAPGGGRYC